MNENEPYSEGFAENSGVKIFYRDYGPIDGDPILMVHGLGAQLVHWPPHLIQFLQAHNFRPITYDNRDVGLSSRFLGTPSFILDYIKYFLRLPIKSEYTIDDMADDGIKLLESLNIHQAHILGTSMGGMIAQIISAQYPQKVKSFTLIASTASTPSPINAPSKPVRDLMMERSRNPNASEEEVIEREIKIVSLIGMEGRTVDTPEFREETIQNLNRAQDGSGYARQLLSILASKDRLKKIQKIKAPTLIIHGTADSVTPFSQGQALHDALNVPKKLIAVPDADHLDYSNEFLLEQIEEFLESE